MDLDSSAAHVTPEWSVTTGQSYDDVAEIVGLRGVDQAVHQPVATVVLDDDQHSYRPRPRARVGRHPMPVADHGRDCKERVSSGRFGAEQHLDVAAQLRNVDDHVAV